MRPEKKWQRYTKLSDIWVNMTRYRSKIEIDCASDCVLWTGAKHAQGYGMVVAIRDTDKKRIMTTTHRVAMRQKLGRALDANEGVTHTCGRPACVNPNHLAFKHDTPANTELDLNSNETREISIQP